MGACTTTARGMRGACVWSAAACWLTLACAQLTLPSPDFGGFDPGRLKNGGNVNDIGSRNPDPGGPDPPITGRFYVVAVLRSIAVDYKWILDIPHIDKNPDARFSFYNDLTVKCTDLWGTNGYTYTYKGLTYELAQDPAEYDRPYTPFAQIRTCNADRSCERCYQTAYCGGCYEGGHTRQHEFLFAITNDQIDDNKRALFAVGACIGSLQVSCDANEFCTNGQYATDFLVFDPVTHLRVTSPVCAPCRPGTWNTCFTPKKGVCVW